jgi:hypothetical protein
MDEQIDNFIDDLYIEADQFFVDNPSIASEIIEFVDAKREAFVAALNSDREEMIESYQKGKIDQPDFAKYFFRYQIENLELTEKTYK